MPRREAVEALASVSHLAELNAHHLLTQAFLAATSQFSIPSLSVMMTSLQVPNFSWSWALKFESKTYKRQEQGHISPECSSEFRRSFTLNTCNRKCSKYCCSFRWCSLRCVARFMARCRQTSPMPPQRWQVFPLRLACPCDFLGQAYVMESLSATTVLLPRALRGRTTLPAGLTFAFIQLWSSWSPGHRSTTQAVFPWPVQP